MGPACGNARLARGPAAPAPEGVRPGRSSVAGDPHHRRQRLVLVVQPQARLWHGPDLGQPVPAAPAQRLQADGLAGARASFPADHQARADPRARRAGGHDQPDLARRRAVEPGRVFPRWLGVRRASPAGGGGRAGHVRQRRRADLLTNRHAALACGPRGSARRLLALLLGLSGRRWGERYGSAAGALRDGRPRFRARVRGPDRPPFAQLGGVADVAASLSKELRHLGHDVRVVLPRYRQVDVGRYNLRPVVTDLQVPLGAQKIAATIYEGRLGDMVVYFVDCPQLYDRDGMFGFGDDDARSVFFSRALLEMLPALEFFPDVIHIHDWYAALVPNLLERVYTDGAYAEIADRK